MSLRTDLEQAMVDARHEAIGYPNPDFCMCRAEEYAGEMSEGVAKFVAEWIRKTRPLETTIVEQWNQDMGL